MMRCWPWLAGRCGEWWRVPVSTPPQPRPAHLRSAEAGPRTGSWSVEADGACPASTASQWPGDGSGYQHTWTCTCARSAPGPQPSPPSSYPPRPHPGVTVVTILGWCSVCCLPLVTSHRCHLWSQGWRTEDVASVRSQPALARARHQLAGTASLCPSRPGWHTLTPAQLSLSQVRDAATINHGSQPRILYRLYTLCTLCTLCTVEVGCHNWARSRPAGRQPHSHSLSPSQAGAGAIGDNRVRMIQGQALPSAPAQGEIFPTIGIRHS